MTFAAAAMCPSEPVAALANDRLGMTLGFGTYGMQSLTTEKAIKILDEIGYDAVELDVGEMRDAAPNQMPKSRRREIATRLADSQLQLASLMEHLVPSKNKNSQETTLRHLREAAQLGHDLSPNQTPLIQTTLGGRDWEALKGLFCDRLGKWAEVGREMNTVVAIKPHRGGALSRPREAAWLIQQLGNSPWLRMVYDYSHYAYRDMTMPDTIRTSLPITAHIAIKDVVQLAGSKTTFVLPGQAGTIDYVRLLKQFYAGGYRDDVCCEVSSAVWKKPGYDPVQAARTCFDNLAPVFERARVPRRSG